MRKCQGTKVATDVANSLFMQSVLLKKEGIAAVCQ